MLTLQLRELEADKVITRTVYPEVPPRVEYSLTQLGKSLEPLQYSFAAWEASLQGPAGTGMARTSAIPARKDPLRALVC
jgi:DNA-binding HxlR family transcriptional regulator